MLKLKNLKGEVVIECDYYLMGKIIDRFVDTQSILDYEGNEFEYDKDELLLECIKEQIDFKLKRLSTVSEVEDFKKTCKILF